MREMDFERMWRELREYINNSGPEDQDIYNEMRSIWQREFSRVDIGGVLYRWYNGKIVSIKYDLDGMSHEQVVCFRKKFAKFFYDYE